MTAAADLRRAQHAAFASVQHLADGGPFRRATSAGTLFIVFVLPWSDTIPRFDGITTPLSLLVVGAAVVAILAEGRRRRLSEVQILGAAFLTVGLASLLWTLDQAETQSFVLPIAQLAALLLLTWEFCPGREGGRALARAYVLGCAVAAGVALATSVLGGAVEDDRLKVGHAQPNDLAYALSLGIPIAWYLACRATDRRARWAYGLIIPAALYTIVLVASRSGLVVALIGVLIVPWTVFEGNRRRLVALMFVGLAAVPLLPQLLPAEQVARLSSTTDELSGGTLNGRTDLWSGAWATFADHPITGVGVGASRDELLARTGLDFRAHNTPLSIAAELGTVGLVAAGLFAVAIAGHVRRSQGLERKLVVVLGLVLVIGLQVRHWEYQPTLWAVLVLLVGVAGPTGTYARASTPRAGALPRNR